MKQRQINQVNKLKKTVFDSLDKIYEAAVDYSKKLNVTGPTYQMLKFIVQKAEWKHGKKDDVGTKQVKSAYNLWIGSLLTAGAQWRAKNPYQLHIPLEEIKKQVEELKKNLNEQINSKYE